MGRPYQILLPLLSLFFVRVDLTDLIPLKISVALVKVLDGDTVEVKAGHQKLRVRLSKLDAPEKGQPFIRNGGPWGNAGEVSRKCALKFLKVGESYVLSINKRDIYGRILGDLEEVSFKLIKAGCSGLYPYAEFDSKEEKFQYLRAMEEARRLNRGLWGHGGYRRPQLWRKSSKQISHRRWHR